MIPSSLSINGDKFEAINEIIIDWIDIKLREICRCIKVFMDYLLIRRHEYKTFSHPRIHLPIVIYIVEEIFNCAKISSIEKPKEVYPEDFSTKTRRLLKEGSSYDIEIGSEVIEYLWKYISFGVSNLTEGLNFEKELSNLKNNRKRNLLLRTKEDIKIFKQKIDNGNESSLKNMAIKTISSYRRLKSFIKKEIKGVTYHLKSFDDEPLYKSDGMGVILSDEDIAGLLEFGIKKKRIEQLNSIRESFNSKTESLKKKGDYVHPFYKSDCENLLKIQGETLHKMKKDLKNSKIGLFIEQRKKNKHTERTGKRELLDRIYETAKSSDDKWKRASIARIFIEDADYEIKKKIPIKSDHESSEKWISGKEDMGDKELKLTEEMIDEEYVNFSTSSEWKKFLNTAYLQLKDGIEEVVTDRNLINLVSQRIANKIQERIITYQTYVSMRECDHGLDDDIDNCILQSLIYLSISISDWLETPTIGKDELITALKILLPEGLQKLIDLNPPKQNTQQFTLKFNALANRNGVTPHFHDSEDIITSTLTNVKSLSVDDKNFIAFNNRVRYFANSLLPK